MAPKKSPELKEKTGDQVSGDEDETRGEPQPTEDEDIKPADHVIEEGEEGRKVENADGGKAEGEECGNGLNEDIENSANEGEEEDGGKTLIEDEERDANEDEQRAEKVDKRKLRAEKGGKAKTKKGRKTRNEDEGRSDNNRGEKRMDEDVTRAAKQEEGKAGNEDGGNPVSDNKGLSGDLASTISPVRELQTAIQDRREDERRAFDELIRENARLRRRLDGGEAKHQQLLAKYEVKNIELEAEKARTIRLEGELAEMRREMTLLIKAAKKAGVIGNKDNDGDPEREQSGVRGRNGNASVWKHKVGDLEERLLRLTEEDERKSRRLISLERELLDKTRYIEALEEHVTDDVRESLSDLRGEPAAPEMVFTTMGKANNVVYAGRPEPYSYKNNLVQDSAVCAIS